MRNPKPHKQKGRVKMKKEVELIVIRFYADMKNKKLHVPKKVIEEARDLSSVEARLYFERLHRYPGFEIVVE